jgi:septum formation protein
MIICLASQSPRRKLLLENAGYTVVTQSPAIDDGRLDRPNVSPRSWVMSLAYMKARSVHDQCKSIECDLILAADTVCVVDNHVLGQPSSATHARQMLHSMRNRSHITMTGICLLDPNSEKRMLAIDQATVILGNVSDALVEEYITSDQWRGKAGAYNLQERIEASWPIQCKGDPATVMGLPMRKLPGWLNAFLNEHAPPDQSDRMD